MLSVQAAPSALAVASAAPSPLSVSATPTASSASVVDVIMGPPGPQGPQGPVGSADFSRVDFVGVAAGQTVSLGATPGALTMLVLNGRIQDASAFSLSGQSLTLPPGLAWDGADCSFLFNIAS